MHYGILLNIMNKDIDIKLQKLHNDKLKIDNKIKKLSDAKKKIDEEIEELNAEKMNQKSTKIDATKITKKQIIALFKKNIKGKKYEKMNGTHDGSEGHWLESLMNLKHNSDNAPDIGGYEMKKNSQKISFGDWSAEYLFSQNISLLEKINNNKIIMTREQFIKSFGNKSEDKENRYSWSGKCVPKYGTFNDRGQILRIDVNNNILAIYSYNNDKQKDKSLTLQWKDKEICIAVWSKEKMEKHINDKFNQKGFFVCKKNKAGIYDKICFGSPINYELFIEKIKSGDIFFDSGMYHDTNKKNTRSYSQWRASQKFWNNLINEEF